MGKILNINEHAPKIEPEMDERSPWRLVEDEFRAEIEGYEYFKSNGLDIKLFKHSENGNESTKIMLMKKTKVLYQRVFEGYSDEVRYNCMFFMYRDIFNQGLMLADKVSIEQEKLDKEKEIVNKVQSSGIVDSTGKKY